MTCSLALVRDPMFPSLEVECYLLDQKLHKRKLEKIPLSARCPPTEQYVSIMTRMCGFL